MINKNNKTAFKLICILLTSIILLCVTASCAFTQSSSGASIVTSSSPSNPNINGSELKVHYIDVGQGNAVLIEINGKFMLIDAGTAASSEHVVSYLKSSGVTALSYVIATHPHEDHIGGMQRVLDEFKAEQIIMPDKETTTKTFEGFIDKILDKNIPVSKPEPGKTYTLGDASFTVLAPNSAEYKDLNDYSVVTRMVYKNTSFLFPGDATEVSEGEITEREYAIESTVLMIGHHGSATSTSDEFLNKVNPKYAVISVGADNVYNHPTDKILSKLTKKGIIFFRTDEYGDITAISDGNAVKFEKSENKVDEPEITYVCNKNTKAFHYSWCASVKQMKESNKLVFESRDECVSAGYVPCNNCKP